MATALQFTTTAPGQTFKFDPTRKAQMMDVTKDGQRVLIGARELQGSAAETWPRVVVLNWFEKLAEPMCPDGRSP